MKEPCDFVILVRKWFIWLKRNGKLIRGLLLEMNRRETKLLWSKMSYGRNTKRKMGNFLQVLGTTVRVDNSLGSSFEQCSHQFCLEFGF